MHNWQTGVTLLIVRFVLVTIGVSLVSPLFIYSLPITDAATAAVGIILIASFSRGTTMPVARQ